ncbi:glycosyltransferase family 4 protein [Niastella caeni]|uniref:Glycosyltransferase family 4 protein n=1 Tax=Niastella caeni TaxID=2569763 RepID=A0A4S8I2H3_9BACT|nr:glycosyltransferase family 4 protein [Niastella caeni]THU41529.1 glycosyltransferase family 4 protein [Niastella caeni]
MKIAYITTIRGVPWGGSEELWYTSALEAIKRNYEVGVFVYKWDEDPLPIKNLEEKGAMVFKRPRFSSFGKRLINWVSEKLHISKPNSLNPYKEVVSFNPDIIIITDGIYYTADDPWLRSTLKNFKKKYIIVSQGNGPYFKPQDRAETITLFEDAKYVMFVAEQNRRLTFHQLAYELSNSFVIQNPVKLNIFEPIPLPAVNTTIHCAAVGRFLVSDKGQDMLVAMMAEPYWKNSNIIIHLYGKGEDAAYLTDLIKYYNVAEKVIIEPYTDISSIWQKCHCLLMPSLLEGTPLTLLEALVLGRVCIVTRVGGNDEWVIDGVNGYIVEAPTQSMFSEKLKQAISEKEKWPQIAAEAHRSVMAKLDKNPGITLLDKAINSYSA